MTADKVHLIVDDVRLSGWQSVNISRSLDTAAAKFSLDLARPADAPGGHPVVPGQAVRVELGSDCVISGYVDLIRPYGRSNSHGLAVVGRSKTADLVDCSAINKPGQWRGTRLIDIAKALADPFGVIVRDETSDAKETVANFEIEQGETAWAAIERLIRLKGMSAYDAPDGALILTRPAGRKAQTALIKLRDVDGKSNVKNNVLSSEATLDLSRRFSEITVKGQKSGTDFDFGLGATSIAGKAVDLDVPRYRPLVITAETSVDSAQAERRAQWESSRRMGRSTTASFTLPGWRQSVDGPLWDVNLVVPVRDDGLGIDADMLVTAVAWSLSSERGCETKLTMQPPAAYQPKPIIPAGQGAVYGRIRKQIEAAEAAAAAGDGDA